MMNENNLVKRSETQKLDLRRTLNSTNSEMREMIYIRAKLKMELQNGLEQPHVRHVLWRWKIQYN